MGLGGDPFPSSVVGATGWWDRPEYAGDAFVGLSEHYEAPITRRLSRRRGLLNQTLTELSGQKRWTVAGRTLRTGFRALSARVQDEYRNDLSRISLEEDGAALRGEARLLDLLPGLDLQADLPMGHTSERSLAYPLRYGLRYRLANRLWIEAHRSQSLFSPTLTMTLESERVDSPLNMSLDELNYGLRVRLCGSLVVESRIWEGKLDPDRNVDAAFHYELQPDGDATLRQHELNWGRPGKVRAVLRYTRLRGHSEAEGFWGGERYVRVADGYLHLNSWLGAVELPVYERDRLIFDVTAADYEGFVWSKIESWPFVSWQVAWVGGAKVAEVTLDGTWQRYHLGYEGGRAAFRWTGGLSWYELRPNLTVDSWTKVVLGKMDRATTTLGSDRYSLAALSLGGTMPLGALSARVRLHQFVYADDHLRQGPPAEPAEPEVKTGWYGGTYAEVSLTFRR